MLVQLAQPGDDLTAVCKVLNELRSQYSLQELITTVEEQMNEGFHVAWVEEDSTVLCVAGFVFGHKLAWGKSIYVDDLVTSETTRSRGAGALMIKWLKQHALDNGCRELHLDSGVQRFRAHRFYLREGFDIIGHHFSITNLSAS